jgi:predicted Rossmann fold nucleotide-binding protein DprA/Smf involved in DNA uptake
MPNLSKRENLHECAVDEALELQPITIRLQKSIVDELKVLAKLQGIGYQPYVRLVLTRHVREQQDQNKKLLPEPVLVELYGKEKELYEMLSDEPVHFDVLCERSGMAAGELSATLTMLELGGVVTRHPGDWYTRI